MTPREHVGEVVASAIVLLVGTSLARRLWEVRRTRAGAHARLGPATRTIPGRQGPLARWIEGWQPEPPRTRLGRLAGAAWAGPLTTVGGLLAALGGARAQWDPRRGCWVTTGVAGPSGTLLRALGLHANAIGQVVIVRTDRAAGSLLDHEAVHVRQAERLGPVLPVLYAWFSARYGYRENPLERGARRGAARAAV